MQKKRSRIQQLNEREKRKKDQRKLRAELASLHRALRIKSPEFRRMLDIKKKLELF